MRIVHVIPSIAEESSGPSYSVRRLCEALAMQGTQVTLASIDSRKPRADEPHLETFAPGPGPSRLGSAPAMKRWLRETARAGELSLLHNHSLWMMPNVYAGWIARESRLPLVVSPRGTLSRHAMKSGSAVKRVFWPLVQRPALRPVTCFHATAESECEDIRRMGFRQPVAILPNGIDLPSSLPRAAREMRTLLYLGRIHPIKGLDMLLPAWAALEKRHPEWRLRIVGGDNGGHLEAMRRLAGQLKLDRAEFSGPLHGEGKWRAYREADLFVLPSYSENFGVCVAEALACGIPAIVSKAAPWAGLSARSAGWWVDTGVDPLVAALEDALSRSAEDLAEMGARGRRWMEQDFSWPVIARKMEAAYRWILDGGSPPDCVRTS